MTCKPLILVAGYLFYHKYAGRSPIRRANDLSKILPPWSLIGGAVDLVIPVVNLRVKYHIRMRDRLGYNGPPT